MLMQARTELAAAFAAWEEWTEREGHAIQAGNWKSVCECQTAKLELQGGIADLTAAAKFEGTAAGINANELEDDLRPILSGLIALETRNAQILARGRTAVSARLAEMEQVNRNLRRVRKFYGQPARAAWQSYS